MKSRVFVLIKLMEELGLPVSRLMGQSSNVLPITKPVLTKSTIDLSSVNTKSLAKESTDTLNLLRNNKLSGQEIEQTIRNLEDIKATTKTKPSATVIELSTKETIPTEGVMNLAKQQEMSKSIPGKAKQLQGRVENIEKDFTDFTKALDARGEIPGASRQEAIEIAKAKMKGMGYAAEEIEDIAKDPKRIQIATDIIIPDEGFQMGGRVGLEKGGKPPKVKTTIPMNPMMEEGFDPGKRGFLKGTGAAGLGLAALGTGAVRLGKKASKKIKDIDIDMGVDVDGDYSDVAERYEAFYNTFFKIKANTKAGKKVLDKLAKEKKIVKEKDGSYYADTMGDIDSPAIDALEDIKNQSSYDFSFEGKKFKNTDEAGDYFRGNTKEASPVKPDY